MDDDIAKYLKVSPEQGLSLNEVAKRQDRFGANRLGKPETRSWMIILLAQFKSPLMALLGFAAGLSVAFGDIAEGIAILVVVAINGAIGFWAESKAELSMAALRQMGRATTRVRRAGRLVNVPAEDLVPGDIALFEAGDIVTADCRLLETVRLQSDESLLTGESVPVDKDAVPVDSVRSNEAGDRKSVV